MKLTQNEIAVMTAIHHNYYGDGVCTWSHCIDDSHKPSGLKPRSIGGVVGSLQKKGLLTTDGESVWLTQAGIEYNRTYGA